MLEIAQKIDWREIEAVSAMLLSRLVGYDTSSPPGNTSGAANFIYETIQKEGIFATVVPSGGEKRNVLAQVDGSGQLEPCLVMAPLDVVRTDAPVPSEFNPFSGYDDGTHIWGRGTIAAKSLLVAQMMAVILVQRMGVPLKRNLRFAGIADGFGPGPGGLEYLAEHHLTLMEAERCLSFGYPPSAELPGKIVFFLHCAERGVLRLTLRSEGKCGALGETGAVQNLLGGIRALADEFAGDFAGDRETRRVFDGLRAASTDKSVADALMQIDRDPALKADPNRQNDRGIPEALIGYLRSLKRTPLTVTFIHAGSSGGVGARCAEAEVAIMPCPGMSLSQCGAKAVAALEKLGPDAPYIAKASQSAGSASRHDDELHRVLQAACRSVSPGAELVEAVSPVNLGLSVLRQLGIEVWGFNPLELPLGLDDGARRAFSNDERIAKSSLGRMVRVMFEALVRLAS